ncbi:glycosyltransferase family 4 protein [Candidatus Parcubacteria bacterium]|nr:glycosyltransferase family 4 protein [Candidatus Parcubacteria bacterium]
MRIGIFTNIYLPIISGVVTIIENYRKELERQGHKVYIFAAKQPGYRDENPRVFRFKSIDLNYKISYPLPIISSSRINRTIKKINLDIAHTQHFFVCGQIAWYYAKKFNIPLVFTQHTRYEYYTHYIPYLPKEISKPLALSLRAFYANSCDAVIAPTEDIKNSLLKYKVKTPITILPSGVDLERFSKANKETIKKKYNIDEDKIVLLTVSRLAPEKNISFLLKSFKKTILKNPDVYFIIVGDGPSKKSLESQSNQLELKNRVIFTGEIEQEKIPSFYKAADIFLFSSFSEVQPTVITEAMASGLPIVAVKAGGIKNAIIDGENGILAPNGIDEFSKEVLKLINNEELRGSISEKARKMAKNYSVENATKKLLNLYQKLIIQKKKDYKSQNNFALFKDKFLKNKFNQILTQK